MGLLDDTAIFSAVIQHGSFSHAAKQLGLSSGLISRRIAQLEAALGVTLIKRTTRQLQLTPEGDLLWQHAQRIQHELDSAVSQIQTLSKKPKGVIHISAPPYFGRHYLTPLLTQFLDDFNDIDIFLSLSNQAVDLIKEKFDLVIRGSGYTGATTLKDSNLQTKLLYQEEIGLYAAPSYLAKWDEPKSVDALSQHRIIQSVDETNWRYLSSGKQKELKVKSKLHCNDIETGLIACVNGAGIGRFTDLNVKAACQQNKLRAVLTQYNWGKYYLYALYPQQNTLPQRTRVLLDFIFAHAKQFLDA